jgi:hypothetical protein
MPRGLPAVVRAHLDKARTAAISAVEVYNRPGPHFRTAHFVVLMTMAWTALFHAIFCRRNIKPWHSIPKGKRVRYVRLNGEPKHWELSECLRHYYGNQNPPTRENLRFLIGLRNKIEHRHLPELDPSLYGECQASLMNFEDLLSREFGPRYALQDTLAVALQFSRVMPPERGKALKRLASSQAKDLLAYIERFRTGLPPEILNSSEYSFSVYLIPKTANRASAADLSVEFVPYDPANPLDAQELDRVVALIREKHVPVANMERWKPGEVVRRVKEKLPFHFSSDSHVKTWKHYKVRPESGTATPERTKTQYCVYDCAHKDYVYTSAWVDFLVSELSDPVRYREVLGKTPVESHGPEDGA